MEDKFLMENVLYASKVINDLYMHGVIESSNDKVMLLFNKLIGESLKMHNELFKAMETAGIYSTNNVEEAKLKKVKEKIENSCQKCNCDTEK